MTETALGINHPVNLVCQPSPYYATRLGATYLHDSRQLLPGIPDESVNLIVTSPPYALHFKKEYGNADKEDYVEWFRPFAEQMRRILTDDGSFVLNIGGSYNPGAPTRSLYHFKVLLMLCEEIGFHLAQECFWFNPAKLPSPAEWVNVRRMRIKDSVEYIWWFSKSPFPKADNRRVLQVYSDDMTRLLTRGYRAKRRPSGHTITSKFNKNHGGSIAPNVINVGNNESNSEYLRACELAGYQPHPARFPSALPDFFIRMLTDEGDLVLDPFAGSNVTGAVAEGLSRHWLAIELREDYVRSSQLRFAGQPRLLEESIDYEPG